MMRWFRGRQLGLLAALAALGALGNGARAGVVNFEDLGVPFNSQINTPDGVGIVTGGFNYTPGPINDAPFNQLYISNQQSFWSFNGTTVGGTNDDVVLTKVGGGAFSLSQFDFAGFPGGELPLFTVTGLRADSTTIVNTFTPDGLSDGPGGVADFQTFTVTGNWSNLVSVSWAHFGPGTIQGLFALDNMVVDAAPNAVPEPASLALLGTGALGLAAHAWRRKRRPQA